MASISDILLAQGQQAAESRQRQGSLNAALVGNLGGLTAESLQQYGAQRQAKLRSQKVYDLITNPDTTPEQILGTLGPDEGMKVLKAFSDMSALNTGQRKAAQDDLPHLGQLYASLDDEHKAAIYPTIRQAVVKSGVPDSALPKDYQAGALEPLLKAVPKDAEPYTLGPGSSRFGADNQQVASVPAEPKAKPQPTIASLAADAADLTSPTHLQSAEALKSARAPAQPQYVTVKDPKTGQPIRKSVSPDELATGVPVYERPRQTLSGGNDDDEASAIADAIISGKQPPELTGLYRFAAPVRAKLAQKGYDQTTALTDWRATQKHLSSLNGAQQTRLQQQIQALPDLLDSVDALAAKWKGGKFPILNRANLAAAKGGIYGPDVASVANQLDTQIADVVSDLGGVYMGGNSPTDHALGLAAKSLSADWNEQVLHDMVKLAKSNVQIRKNSLNIPVAGVSAENPYATQAPAPSVSGGPVKIQLGGKTFTFQSQADADAFRADAAAAGIK